ncbi:MAG: hypothetical protein ACXV8O_20140 [Methylobacter sp.]
MDKRKVDSAAYRNLRLMMGGIKRPPLTQPINGNTAQDHSDGLLPLTNRRGIRMM